MKSTAYREREGTTETPETQDARLVRGAGFRTRRHAFNRTTEDGLVHVVRFWMAPKEPPAWTEMPGLRERLYGKFRLDFGVHIPEIRRMGAPVPGWINEYNCQLRQTIGQLLGDGRSTYGGISTIIGRLGDAQADGSLCAVVGRVLGPPTGESAPDSIIDLSLARSLRNDRL